jgi:hypothetical protein
VITRSAVGSGTDVDRERRQRREEVLRRRAERQPRRLDLLRRLDDLALRRATRRRPAPEREQDETG